MALQFHLLQFPFLHGFLRYSVTVSFVVSFALLQFPSLVALQFMPFATVSFVISCFAAASFVVSFFVVSFFATVSFVVSFAAVLQFPSWFYFRYSFIWCVALQFPSLQFPFLHGFLRYSVTVSFVVSFASLQFPSWRYSFLCQLLLTLLQFPSLQFPLWRYSFLCQLLLKGSH